MVVISRCVTEALRYVTVVHDLSRLLARSVTACYVLWPSVILRLHYVPGGHGSHVSDNREQNGITVRQRRGTG